MTAAEPAVRLSGLSRRFGEVMAVDNLDLEVQRGQFFSLIGPSGCGKTTTLRMIAGLEDPTAGRVSVSGRDITNVAAFRRPVNTVFQQYALFPHLDVFENVAFGLRERRVGKRQAADKVGSMLALVGLEGRERARPAELSGGQQQRVALARALVLEPEVLLLDEPLGALDLKLRRQMQLLLKRVQREVGITFVYVTHDQEEAFAMSDQVGVMCDGKLDQVGQPVEVYQCPRTLFVADFVGASNRLEGRLVGSEGQGRHRVQLQDGSELVAPGPEGLASGQSIAVIVRPEAIRLGSDPGCDRVLAGVVHDASFVGPSVFTTVELSSGQRLMVASAGDAIHNHPGIGDRVEVSLTGAKAWIVPVAEALPTDRPARDTPQPQPAQPPAQSSVSS
jgi:spermidine/putrescine transport system ATP-binding protein